MFKSKVIVKAMSASISVCRNRIWECGNFYMKYLVANCPCNNSSLNKEIYYLITCIVIVVNDFSL